MLSRQLSSLHLSRDPSLPYSSPFSLRLPHLLRLPYSRELRDLRDSGHRILTILMLSRQYPLLLPRPYSSPFSLRLPHLLRLPYSRELRDLRDSGHRILTILMLSRQLSSLHLSRDLSSLHLSRDLSSLRLSRDPSSPRLSRDPSSPCLRQHLRAHRDRDPADLRDSGHQIPLISAR